MASANYPRCFVEFFARLNVDYALDYALNLYRQALADGIKRGEARDWIKGICAGLIDADELQKAIVEFDFGVRVSDFHEALEVRDADEEKPYWFDFCNSKPRRES